MSNNFIKEQLALVSTATLPQEVSEVMRAAAIEQKKHVCKLRDYGWVDTSPDEGADMYIWNVADALSVAGEVAEGASPDYEDANATKSSDRFKKIMKAFKLSWEADHLKKINIRAAQTRAAVSEVFDREDYWIATQLISDAANTLTGTDWSANTADPVKDIRNAKRLNKDDGYMSDLMYLNPTNNEELDSVIASNTWYSITEQTLKTGEPIPFMGLKRVECTWQTLGTASVLKSGISGAYQTGEAKPLGINMFDDKDDQVTKVQVYMRTLPCATVRTKALATITSI